MNVMKRVLLAILLPAAISACGSVEIQPGETDEFADMGYTFYRWHSAPVQDSTAPGPGRALDPTVRQAVDETLQAKGYTLDPDRAQFTVGYRYGGGIREGVASDEASNITYYPATTINRKVDQASRDNAIALGGVRATTELEILMRDAKSQLVVWQVVLTEIVEDANQVDTQHIDKRLRKAIPGALRPLPDAP